MRGAASPLDAAGPRRAGGLRRARGGAESGPSRPSSQLPAAERQLLEAWRSRDSEWPRSGAGPRGAAARSLPGRQRDPRPDPGPAARGVHLHRGRGLRGGPRRGAGPRRGRRAERCGPARPRQRLRPRHRQRRAAAASGARGRPRAVEVALRPVGARSRPCARSAGRFRAARGRPDAGPHDGDDALGRDPEWIVRERAARTLARRTAGGRQGEDATSRRWRCRAASGTRTPPWSERPRSGSAWWGSASGRHRRPPRTGPAG